MKIIVIRKAGGLGDVICCEPVIRGLRKQYPHADITFIFPPEYKPLFEDRKDATYKSLHYVRMTARWLKKYEADNDIFINLCGPESNDEAGGSPQCSRIESFCHYAEVEATSPRLDLTRKEHEKAHEAFSIYPKPWVGFGINGRQWAKNWPTEYWKELAGELPGTVFYFDQGDVLDLGEKVVPIVGRELREVMGLISVLDLMITVDTGLLHTAAALGTKTLSLWGPTDPHRTLKHYKDAYFVEPAPYREVSGCPKPCLHDPWNCGPDGKKYSRCMHAMKSGVVAEHAIEILRDKAVAQETRSVSKAKYYKSKDGIPPAPEGKKRIVFAAKHLLPPMGGAERYALEMLKQLRDDGHDVVAIWSHPENSPFRHLSIEQTDGITWVQSPEGVMLNKVLAAEPDIVITQLRSAPKIAKIIPKTTRLFLFLHSVGEHFCERIRSGECIDGSPINLLTCPGCDDRSFRNMRLAYQCADEVFAVSQAMADVFQKFTGREALVQYPVVDPVRCEVSGETTKEYCVAIKPTEDRGHQFLYELANMMPREQFLWVDAPKCNLPNVTVLEHTEDLKDVFGKAFLLLAPHKHFEAFGRCPVEAGLDGVPSIVSASGGLPEAVGDGGLVLSLNPSEWVDAINGLRKDDRRWQVLSGNARRHSMAFNWDALRSVIDTPVIASVPKKPFGQHDDSKALPVKQPLALSIIPQPGRKVTIITACYNRADNLCRTLYSQAMQHPKLPVETLIIDDGSTENIKEIVEECEKKFPNWEFRYIRHHRDPGFSSPAISNNIGLVYARGDIIIQSGADVLHLGETINALLDKMTESEGYYSAEVNQIKENQLSSLPLDDSERFQEMANNLCSPYPIHQPEALEYANAPPYCAIYKKEWAYKIGLYDETYGPGGGEDDDFVYRMQRVVPTRWYHGARVAHQNHPKFSGEERFDHGYLENVTRARRVLREGVDPRWRTKILFLGSFNLFPWSGFLWDSLRQSFLRLGHECRFFDALPESKTDEDCASMLAIYERNWIDQSMRAGQPRVLEEVSSIIEEFQPKVIFAGIPAAMAIVRDLAPKCLKVGWFGDMRKPESGSAPPKGFDCFFLTNEAQVREYEKTLGCPVYPTAFGINPTGHYRLNIKKEIEIGFSGQYDPTANYGDSLGAHHKRVDLLNRVGGIAELSIWDMGWSKTWDFYSKCKIVISDSCDAAHKMRGYTSNRFFNVMGCGAFCLVRRFPGLDLWGSDGVHFVAFDTDEEACEKIKYYLSHDQERQQIADAGYRWFHAYHNWMSRAKYMSGIFKKELETRNGSFSGGQ